MRILAIAVAIALLAACAPASKPVRDTAQAKVPPLPQPTRLERAWNALAAQSAPSRDAIRERFRYVRSYDHVGLDGFRSLTYNAGTGREVVGFSVINDGSSRINPRGRKGRGSIRKFTFLFPDRARENIYLTINDDVALSRRFSHDNMFRELHFFPRRQLPSATRTDGDRRLLVTLATGEPVVFDTGSKEIVDGVLDEHPIDFNPSRHVRRNPDVRYQGKYLAITVAQRGEAPRRQTVWGGKKYAEVHYPAKYDRPCRLSPALIWDQRPKPGDSDPTLVMLHKTDDSLFDLIERRCQWDLADLRLAGGIRQAAKAR